MRPKLLPLPSVKAMEGGRKGREERRRDCAWEEEEREEGRGGDHLGHSEGLGRRPTKVWAMV